MDPRQLVLLIPIIAIVLALGTKLLKIWTAHLQEMAIIKGTNANSQGIGQSGDFESLRREIMLLRDVTTQYDMSVEKSLHEIRNRLAHVESQVGIQPSTIVESTPAQPPWTPQVYNPIMASDQSAQPETQTAGLG